MHRQLRRSGQRLSRFPRARSTRNAIVDLLSSSEMRNCVAAATLLLAMLDTGVVVVTGAPTMRPTFAGMCGGAELASCDAINGFCACSNLACTGTLCGCNAGYECSGAGLSGCLVCSLAAPPAGAPTMNPDAPSRAPTAGPPSAPEPESTRQLAGSTEARDIFMATEMSIVLGLIAALCCTGCFASAIGVAAFYIVRLARATYEGELLPPLPGGAEWPWWKRMDSDLTAVGALAQRVFGAVRDAIDGTPAALRRGRVRLDEESGVELRFDERPPDVRLRTSGRVRRRMAVGTTTTTRRVRRHRLRSLSPTTTTKR